jgi:hypothetical protein
MAAKAPKRQTHEIIEDPFWTLEAHRIFGFADSPEEKYRRGWERTFGRKKRAAKNLHQGDGVADPAGGGLRDETGSGAEPDS